MSEILSEYQTLIGVVVTGIFGFLGVVYTLHVNAKLARSAQAEEWLHERNLRKTEQKREQATIRESLLLELTVMREVVSRQEELLKTDVSNLAVDTDFEQNIFRTISERIGLLPASVGLDVMKAYRDIRLYRAALLAGGELFRGSNTLVTLRPERKSEAVTYAKDVLTSLDTSIDSLKNIGECIN